MVRVITFLWRLIWITAAILAAILAGLALYFTTTRLAMGHIPDAGVFVTQLGSYLMSLMAERPAHALLTLGFVAAAVGTLEYAGMRSGITYGAAAAACAGLTIFIIADVPVMMMGANVSMAIQAVMASFAAGLVYWVLAGRSAGHCHI